MKAATFEPCGHCGTSVDRLKDDRVNFPIFCGSDCEKSFMAGYRPVARIMAEMMRHE